MLSADGCTIGPFFGGGKRVAVRLCAEVYHTIAWGHLILPGGRLTSFCVWAVCAYLCVLPGSRRNARLAFRAPVPRPAQKGEEHICRSEEARRAQASARQCWQREPCSSSCSHLRQRALRPQALRPIRRPRVPLAATLSSNAAATRRKPFRSRSRSQAQCLGAARRRQTIRRSDEPAWTGTASSRSYVQGLAPRHRLRHRHRRPSPANATRRAATAPCATTGAGSACTTTSGAGFARAGGRRARAASTRERGRLTTRSLQTAST